MSWIKGYIRGAHLGNSERCTYTAVLAVGQLLRFDMGRIEV
jgi:hypothetical protein